MASRESMIAQIKSIEAQLALLRAQIEGGETGPSHTLGELYGLLEGQSDSGRRYVVIIAERHSLIMLMRGTRKSGDRIR